MMMMMIMTVQCAQLCKNRNVLSGFWNSIRWASATLWIHDTVPMTVSWHCPSPVVQDSNIILTQSNWCHCPTIQRFHAKSSTSFFRQFIFRTTYSVSQKNPPWGLVAIFPKRLGIFQPNFARLLRIPIYARLQIFIQLPASVIKLRHIKRDHPVHIMCARCPPSAETHAGIFWHFSQQLRIFTPNFTHLLTVHMPARKQIFIQLSPIMTKLCLIKCDHPACISVDGGHFEHIMVVARNMA